MPAILFVIPVVSFIDTFIATANVYGGQRQYLANGLLCALLAALCGCGQTGALYLPPASDAPVPITAPIEAAQVDDQQRDAEDKQPGDVKVPAGRQP